MNDNTLPPLFAIDVDETKSLSCRTCGTDLRRRLRAALRERFPDVMCLLLDEKRVVELPASQSGTHYLPIL